MKLYKIDSVSLNNGKWIAKFTKNEISYKFWAGYITYYFPVNSVYNQNPSIDIGNQNIANKHLSFVLKNNKLWKI